MHPYRQKYEKNVINSGDLVKKTYLSHVFSQKEKKNGLRPMKLERKSHENFTFLSVDIWIDNSRHNIALGTKRENQL